MHFSTQTIVTAAALILGIGLVAYAAIAERRPRKSLNPRLIPTTPLMFIGVVVVLLSLLHFATLAGVQLPSRR
jgi:energy-converting hydrogenase Eha subunit A